ncbi:MAG TPA: formate dehydrogenase accessory protein FdhE, partial [Thermoanaerobaculia bacterium]
MKPLTREGWLEAHAYLQPVAALCAEVDRFAEQIEMGSPAIPSWEDYLGEFQEGVPLLQSSQTRIDLEPAGRGTALLARKAASESALTKIASEAVALDSELRRDSEAPRRVAAWLLGDESLAPPSPGLLRYLGWTMMNRYLSPLRAPFGQWRDDERWLRNYCPTCGSAPAMSQLVGMDQGRKRLLVCGRCGTRWLFKRTECPFCGNDPHRLAVLSMEGEGGLRIDYCESCKGYLKTYAGEGNEALLLSDWSSLHLDL